MVQKRVTDEARIIGENLRRMRCGAGLSLEDVGRILQISQQQVRKYECGQNRFPVEKLFRLRAYYNVPYDLFFEGVAPAAGGRDSGWDLFVRLVGVKDSGFKRKILAVLNVLLEEPLGKA